jgi:hypothetical protein
MEIVRNLYFERLTWSPEASTKKIKDGHDNLHVPRMYSGDNNSFVYKLKNCCVGRLKKSILGGVRTSSVKYQLYG